MSIEAKVIADSTSGKARRLTTFQLRYPRFIHAEFMTHRQFSRNASSSRAIPVEKQIDMLLEDMAMPIHWGKNQRGMQAEEENNTLVHLPSWWRHDGLDKPLKADAEGAWTHAGFKAVEAARAFVEAGYHKQAVNRILEPFSHISVVCTSTQYDNFFALRRHPDAQPEIKVLADVMFEAMQASTPTELREGEWHLPYIQPDELQFLYSKENLLHDPIPLSLDDLIKASVSRCARVSYLTHDGEHPQLSKDLALYERLVGSVPLHASPAEHQATPDSPIWNAAELAEWSSPHLAGNLTGGWKQFRKMLPGECQDSWEGLNDFGN
jgi:thymidylate synthase ThyX